jgi:hypothetical protein
MTRTSLVLLALLGWGAPARAQWEANGHLKYQFSLQHFDAGDLGALLVAPNPLDQRMDGRLNVTRRRRRLEVTASGEWLVLWGDAVAASGRASGVPDFLLGLPDLHDTQQWVASGASICRRRISAAGMSPRL